MKFSTSFSTLLVLSPLFLSQVSALAVPEAGLISRDVRARAGEKGHKAPVSNQAAGGKGKASSTSAAAAAGSTVAASNASAVDDAGASNATAASNATSVDNAGASNSSSASSGDAQSSLTLDPRVLATGFENDGQDVPEAGQVASLTSSNNFINFCLTVPNLPITNGKQITTGSCNPAPIGIIPASTKMPSAKFVFPTNQATIAPNTEFTIQMSINNMDTGNFVNAQENYFAAPQQLNSAGLIIGHSHVVVESISSLTQTTTTDPTKFAFFKGLNGAAVGGILTADVTSGLPAGTYRLASINTAANHQPAIVPIAQHGSLDDAVYFTVSAAGSAASNATDNAAAGGSTSSAASTAASSVAAGSAASSAASSAAGGAASAAASSTATTKGGANGGKKVGTPAAGTSAAGNKSGPPAAANKNGPPAAANKNGNGKRRFFIRDY